MDEKKIQHSYVMEFLCRREEEGGLGYRSVSVNTVSNDLFIPSVLAEFVSNSVPETWERLLREFNHDEQALLSELKTAVLDSMMDYQNVAIFLNNKKTISFHGEQIPLFYVSGTELSGDDDFEKNIFCAVEESSHTVRLGAEKLYTVRPDITFYLNGIYLGYMELKAVSMGQTAMNEGRQKVVKDYLSTVKAFVQREKTDPSVGKQRKRTLAIYEKAIHLVTSDCNETYVMRNIAHHYNAARQAFAQSVPQTVVAVAPQVVKDFKEYPISSQMLSQKERFEEVMRALYAKKMVEKEILYYNFIKYKYVKKDGQKSRTTNTGQLICPRPKQKFGCDKIMGRIREMLDHEQEPDYYTDKLRRELLALGIPVAKTEEIILKRQLHHNNKYVYSLLLQYAAGFGKSNIIGWTALQLKDYRYNGVYAYDKVLLVVDRLQLRDQLDTTMMNMNIDKSMFVEATDKDTFIKALGEQQRIIVVNIQKFLDLQDAISASGTKLRKMRVAFLIDEIHRSNFGDNNKEMLDLFSRLQETFTTDGGTYLRKNLLIGFTATPSDETLVRFGEFRSVTTPPLWIPFDCYSMREAIADGYILDPTKHIIPFTVPVDFELPEGVDPDTDDAAAVSENKEKVYAFEPRMRKIATFIVDRLVSLVYGKIRGEGKAMLAVSTIPNAIKYCHIIRELYAKKCEEKLYSRYKDAPIAIVYSDSQAYEPCASLNGGLSEETVIQNFRNAKNGIIIVVDKLQTGFDEQKLHTLFLDKEIKDINAIQTISRVNRTCNYKEECHVVDCSWQNVNVENIKTAFKKFCDMVVSQFSPEEEVKNIKRLYGLMTQGAAAVPYTAWFSRFQKEREDVDFVLEMEDSIRKWIKQCFAKEEAARKYNEENDTKPGDADWQDEYNFARDLRMYVGQYGSSIESLRDVYTISQKYTDKVFLSFWQKYCAIYRDATKKDKPDGGYYYEVVDSSELPGITLVDNPEDTENGGGKHKPAEHSKPSKPKEKSMEEILRILQKLNAVESMNAQQAQLWLKEIGLMFQYMKQDGQLCAILKDEQFGEEEKLEKYHKAQGRYKRTELKNRTDFPQVERFKKMLDDNVEQLYHIFINDLKNVENEDSDFDYDTTEHELTENKKFSLKDFIDREMEGRAKAVPFTPVISTDESLGTMAAESIDVSRLPEEERIDLLRRAIVILQDYNPKKSPFNKQRHWESLFRIAADHGFVIDGTPGYEQFKRFVDTMNLRDLPAPLTVSVLERYNVGVYAQDFSEWTSEGLTGNKLKEFEDIKQVAELFEEKVKLVAKRR